MHTGDTAIINAERYCTIVGWINDMVIRGGENIDPREIEEHLHRHPIIQDVQVFGVPDAKYGEELCTGIMLSEAGDVSEEEIKDSCQGRSPTTRSQDTSASSPGTR